MSRKLKISILLLAVLVIHVLLSWGYKRVMHESQLMKCDREMLSLPAKNYNLIAGNSHALSVQTEYWENSHVIASYGEEIHQSYFKLKHILEVQSSRPDTLLLSFDLGMMHQLALKNQAHQWYWNKYESSRELAPFASKKFEFYSHRIVSGIFPYMDGEVEVYDYFFAKKDSTQLMRKSTEIKKLDEIPPLRQLSDTCLKAQFSPCGIHFFEALLQLCKENSIVLALVRFPVTPHYYWSQSTCFEPEAYYTSCDSMLQKSGVNFKILDFHDRYEEEFFRDPHHLKGGEIRKEFTIEILKELHFSH